MVNATIGRINADLYIREFPLKLLEKIPPGLKAGR